MARQAKIGLLLAGVLFLTGCVHIPTSPVFKYIAWQARQIKLQQYKNWKINGVLSVTNNRQRNTATFSWEQSGDHYSINISGPMNLHRVKILGDLKLVEICCATHKCIKVQSPELALFNQFGWWLPISNMRYWIIGALASAEKIEKTSFDRYGHLIMLRQHDWEIRYSKFQPINNLDLPSIVELYNKNLFVKIKIDL